MRGSIVNAKTATTQQKEEQVLVFTNDRVLPVVEQGRVGVGVYKLDRDTTDLTDESPFKDGLETDAAPLNGGSNREQIPETAIERIYGEGFLDISNLNDLPVLLTRLIAQRIRKE